MPLEPEIPLSQDLGQINDESVKSISVVPHKTKDPKIPDYSCQFMGDTMSMLADANDVCTVFLLGLHC